MTESVMVMIPLLLTFLSVLQVSTGVMSRTVATNVVQGSAAQASMGSSESSGSSSSTSGSAINGSATNSRNVPLPGGGSITITERQIHQASITPLMPGGDNFEVSGIAITE